MKPSRISRMVQILTALQSGRNNRVDELAKMYNLSRRMIFRDLKVLKKIGIPYLFDAKSSSYTTDPDFFLPPSSLIPKEAMALLLLADNGQNCIQMPFKNAILSAIMKLESILPAEINEYCQNALCNIFTTVTPHAGLDLPDKIFVQLLEAIIKRRIVNIRYYLPAQQKIITVDLSPYHLMYNDHRWYVLGKSNLRRGICVFKLGRVKELHMRDKCFIKDEKFNINEYIDKAWSLVPEGKLYHVKLRFMPEVARDVAEVQWQSTQKVTFDDDGTAILEFYVDGLNEITWWILGYGDKVQVLAPRTLRKKIIKIAREIVTSNLQEQPVK